MSTKDFFENKLVDKRIYYAFFYLVAWPTLTITAIFTAIFFILWIPFHPRKCYNDYICKDREKESVLRYFEEMKKMDPYDPTKN